jgi:type IV pilus assembly protein PilX
MTPTGAPISCMTPAARQRGAALVIGLILLMILTILAFTGISTSTVELAMSSNEQFRNNAEQASAAGIELAISRLDQVATAPGAAPFVSSGNLLTTAATHQYRAEARYVGDETGLPQSSADKFIGLHFTIQSDGTSARNANDRQIQGVMVVASADASGGGGTTSQLGTGLP